LLLAVPQMQASWAIILVMAAMIAGGLAGARKVAETMSHKITSMNPGQGFSANLGTGILVSLASLIGLPVSTTHVSVGSLIGIGLVNRRANFSVIGKVLMSWVITLPCAALMGTVAYLLIRGIGPLH
jgi:PiT family inorganic phosphate transporter